MMTNPHTAGIKLACYVCQSEIPKGDRCSRITAANIRTLYRCKRCTARLFPMTGSDPSGREIGG